MIAPAVSVQSLRVKNLDIWILVFCLHLGLFLSLDFVLDFKQNESIQTRTAAVLVGCSKSEG